MITTNNMIVIKRLLKKYQKFNAHYSLANNFSFFFILYKTVFDFI